MAYVGLPTRDRRKIDTRIRLDDENGSVTYTYDDGDRLLTEVRNRLDGGVEETSYGWDANGQMVWREEAGTATTYGWNVHWRLAEVSSGGVSKTYAYDPPARTVIRTSTDGNSEDCLFDEFGPSGFDEVVSCTDWAETENPWRSGQDLTRDSVRPTGPKKYSPIGFRSRPSP